ncbi:MAG: hypothetical protein ACFFDI_18200 [Promethearchaeota archaeon]
MDKIGIICVPQDLEGSRRGVDMKPSAIRVVGLQDKLKKLGYGLIDYGNLHCLYSNPILRKSSNANPNSLQL